MSDARPTAFAIIGCGLVGRKRLASLRPGQLVVTCDLDKRRAQALVDIAGSGKVITKVEEAVSHPEVDAVVVSTPNGSLARVASLAIRSGKHVLVEKPAAISVREITELIELARHSSSCVRVGYNHRYHPALQKARKLVDAGAIGPLMFIRGRYGHGGRPGYESEWRADPAISGGGELIDQGVHVIDLSSWFLGEFSCVKGHAETYFWDMPVEDNAFLSLQTAAGQTAWLHVSCTEWKNTFSLEIYGNAGKLHIEGLGGSYGVERLTYYRMRSELGPPDTTIWEFPGADSSWDLEMKAFLEDIKLGRTPVPGLREAAITLQVVERFYEQGNYSK
jgi:predicted dehydrogenase